MRKRSIRRKIMRTRKGGYSPRHSPRRFATLKRPIAPEKNAPATKKRTWGEWAYHHKGKIAAATIASVVAAALMHNRGLTINKLKDIVFDRLGYKATTAEIKTTAERAQTAILETKYTTAVNTVNSINAQLTQETAVPAISRNVEKIQELIALDVTAKSDLDNIIHRLTPDQVAEFNKNTKEASATQKEAVDAAEAKRKGDVDAAEAKRKGAADAERAAAEAKRKGAAADAEKVANTLLLNINKIAITESKTPSINGTYTKSGGTHASIYYIHDTTGAIMAFYNRDSTRTYMTINPPGFWNHIIMDFNNVNSYDKLTIRDLLHFKFHTDPDLKITPVFT